MKLFIYKNCDACKKALKWMEANGVSFQPIAIDLTPPTAAQLKKWHKLSGLPLKKFFNTSGKIYREMGLSKMIDKMPPDEAYGLLASNGMLIKRPLLVKEGAAVVLGFKPEEYKTFLRT